MPRMEMLDYLPPFAVHFFHLLTKLTIRLTLCRFLWEIFLISSRMSCFSFSSSKVWGLVLNTLPFNVLVTRNVFTKLWIIGLFWREFSCLEIALELISLRTEPSPYARKIHALVPIILGIEWNRPNLPEFGNINLINKLWITPPEENVLILWNYHTDWDDITFRQRSGWQSTVWPHHRPVFPRTGMPSKLFQCIFFS